MPDENKKTFASYFTKKVVWGLSVIVALFSIVGGIWAFEAHYATNTRVDKVEIVHADDINGLEIRLAGALENTQHKLDVRYFQFMYDKLSNDLMELRRQMRRYPEDEILKQDYNDLLNRRSDVKKQLDEAIKKIKVN